MLHTASESAAAGPLPAACLFGLFFGLAGIVADDQVVAGRLHASLQLAGGAGLVVILHQHGLCGEVHCGLCHTLLRSQCLFHAGGTHGASHAQNREFLFKSHCGKVF